MSKQPGKIGHHFFEEHIAGKCGYERPEVLVGPGFGTDVSIVEMAGGMAMAMTSDPLSLIPQLGLEESAWLSVQLMANDMATTGFAPMYGQFVLNLPPHFSKDDFNTYWNFIHAFCKRNSTAITGGHTGFIEGQESTIVGGGTFITIAPKQKLLTSRNAQVGDAILVTKECALSSSSILALSFPQRVQNVLGKEVFLDACKMFYQTSSLKDALTAVGDDDVVTAMHDVTEGGVLGAVYELAIASGHGVCIDKNRIPVGQVQKAICNMFSLDPRYCIGAGAMIITCKHDMKHKVIGRLQNAQIPSSYIGDIMPADYGLKLNDAGIESDIIYQQTDPYWAAFFTALKQGWK